MAQKNTLRQALAAQTVLVSRINSFFMGFAEHKINTECRQTCPTDHMQTIKIRICSAIGIQLRNYGMIILV